MSRCQCILIGGLVTSFHLGHTKYFFGMTAELVLIGFIICACIAIFLDGKYEINQVKQNSMRRPRMASTGKLSQYIVIPALVISYLLGDSDHLFGVPSGLIFVMLQIAAFYIIYLDTKDREKNSTL